MSRDTQPSVLHTRPVAAAPALPLAGHSPLGQELTKTGPQLPLSRIIPMQNYPLGTVQFASSSQAGLLGRRNAGGGPSAGCPGEGRRGSCAAAARTSGGLRHTQPNPVGAIAVAACALRSIHGKPGHLDGKLDVSP